MATINRAPWTALVDDSGQNLDGSIWNKAAIKTVLLDPIDASLLTSPAVIHAEQGQYKVPTSGWWSLWTVPPLGPFDSLRVVVSLQQLGAAGGGLYLNCNGGTGLLQLDTLITGGLVVNATVMWDCLIRPPAFTDTGVLTMGTGCGGSGGTGVGLVHSLYMALPAGTPWSAGGWQLGVNPISQGAGGTQNWSWIVSKV
jgi:hypothetical protein